MKRLLIKYNQRPFIVARDDYGVPHIEADAWASALYGLGYMHAMDRATQLLFARTVASGRSAERIGNNPELLETDLLFRRVGLHLNLDEELEGYSNQEREEFEAYAEGVNDGMLQAGRSLPMWATGFQPEPWNPQSIMLVGNLLNYAGLAIQQQQQERLLLDLIQSGVDDDQLRELFAPRLDDADFDLLRQIKIPRQLSDEALELITDLPAIAGSNAWALRPERSQSGGALLASDPHLEVNRLPAIWYEAVLRVGDRYVMGSTLPGCPVVSIGRTPDLAWGVTYLRGDTSDYFIEDCRRGRRNQWQYRRGDAWHDFQVREETILRKGAEPEILPVLYNELGTLEGEPEVRGEGLHLLVAWTGSRPGVGRSLLTWNHLLHETSVRGAMGLVRHCPQPTLSWIFADREGHIGLQANGWFPQRAPHVRGLLPVPAWDEDNHWRGVVRPASLPGIYDPPEGFVAAANEEWNPPEGPRLVTLPASDARRRRIDERLAQLQSATVEDFQALQYDVVSLQARDLLAVFLPHLPEGELKDRLAGWDCSYTADSREATLFTMLYRRVLLEIFGREPEKHGGIGWRRTVYLCSRAGFSLSVVTAVDRLLQKEDSLWWQGRDKGELIRAAAESVAAELASGHPVPRWSAINVFRFTNRFFEQRRVGRALGFHTGDMPMPGCFATIFQGHLLRVARRESTFAPSYHLVTDLGTDTIWTNLPGGPSESRFSRWYKSDIPRWANGQYKPLKGLDDEPQQPPD